MCSNDTFGSTLQAMLGGRVDGTREVTAPTYYSTRAASIADSITLRDNMKVLDIGSGLCRFSERLLVRARTEGRSGVVVVNVDQGQDLLNEGQRSHNANNIYGPGTPGSRGNGAIFLARNFNSASGMRATKAEWTQGRGFDTVVCLMTIHHIAATVRGQVQWLDRLCATVMAPASQLVFTAGATDLPTAFFGITKTTFTPNGKGVASVQKRQYSLAHDTARMQAVGVAYQTEINNTWALSTPVTTPVAWPRVATSGGGAARGWQDMTVAFRQELEEEWDDIRRAPNQDPPAALTLAAFEAIADERACAQERIMRREEAAARNTQVPRGGRRPFLHFFSMDVCVVANRR